MMMYRQNKDRRSQLMSAIIKLCLMAVLLSTVFATSVVIMGCSATVTEPWQAECTCTDANATLRCTGMTGESINPIWE